MKIDKQFQQLINKLTTEEFDQLEKSILKEGCRDALVLWNDILIDGHNRYKICSKHNIKFKTKEIKLADRNEAEMWIIKNQFARRNLSDIDRMDLAEKLRDMIAKTAKIKQSEAGKLKVISPKASINTNQELAKISGVGETKIKQYRAIKDTITPEQKDELRKGELTVNKVFQENKSKERKQHIQTKAKELPKDKFQVILLDPAWQYDNTGFSMSAEKQYPTMSIQQLQQLKVNELADTNSVMFMWATNPLLKDAIALMEYWGFSYKTNMAWIKDKHTAGFYVFGQHELLLIGVKGSMLPIGKKPKSIITGDNKIHSKKPDIVYQLIETAYPDCKYVELFARNEQTNWTSWGNEI